MNTISRTWLNRRQEATREILQNSRVLDVGSGAAKIIPGAIGIDIRRVAGVNVLARSDRLPFADNSFDTVVMSEAIEHLREPEKTLEEVKRVLRPGGQILVTTPDCTLAWRAVWAAWSRLGSPEWMHTHVTEFTEESFSRMLSAFFEKRQIRRVNHWIMIFDGVNRKPGEERIVSPLAQGINI